MNEAPSRRPMTFTFLELLDRTFRLYRENFLTIVGLVAMVSIPITIISLLLNPATSAALSNQPGAFSRTTSPLQSLTGLLSLIEVVLIYAPLTYIASEYLFNHKVTIGEAFRATRSRFTKMGCGIILLGVFVLVIIVIAAVLIVAIPPALALFGILIYIIVAAYSVFFPVITLEDIGPSTAITRSYVLGKRRFWTVVGLGIILAIITLIVEAILGGSAAVLIYSTTPGRNSSSQLLLVTFLNSIISIFITPISPIAFTLLYYDIRARSEGLDIMLDSSGNPAARPSDFSSPETRFRLDGHDWRNIAILTAIGLVTGLVGSGLIRAFVEQYSRTLR
ncbi:MAG: hypothetical protein GC179_14820 [Anaerolineaceae bacterium]|nr:hypothetical protein [Anaerolineaceae bacterium]